MEITHSLGGLVNSPKVVVELGSRLRKWTEPISVVYRGIMLATGAMVLRNGLIVLVLASQAVTACAIPLTLMLLISAVLWRRYPEQASPGGIPLVLGVPIQTSAALKFELIFWPSCGRCVGTNVISGRRVFLFCQALPAAYFQCFLYRFGGDADHAS